MVNAGTAYNDVLVLDRGNVGIGTTDPSQKLHVSGNIRVTGAYYDSANGAGTSGQILSSTGTGTAWIAAPSGGITGSGTTNYVTKWTSGSAVGNSSIYDNGNVGIGTTLPDSKLRIQNDNATVPSLTIRDGGTPTADHIRVSSGTYGDAFFVKATGLVGIGTSDPIASLDNQGSAGTYRQRGFTTMVTNTLAAAGTQAKRYEIARASIDYNDWNSVGPIEVELYEKYYSRGLKKKYVIYYGYVSASGCNLVEMTGSGDNQFMVSIGPEVVISGDNRYIPIYVDVRYYSQVTAILKTNRGLTTSNPPGIADIWTNSMPTGVDISDFTPDSTVYVGNIIGGNSTFSTGNVGIGTTAPENKLDVRGITRILSDDAITAKILHYTPSPYGMVFRAYGSGANSIQVQREANDAELFPLVLQPNGSNVGIGTTSPVARLTVVGAATVIGQTNVVARFSDDINSTLLISHPASTSATATITGNEQLGFATGSVGNIAERMRITAAGNVGIGTTSPAANAKLTIDGSGGANTSQIDMVGYSSTAKGHLGQFANAIYLSTNYYYSSAQYNDTATLGQAAIVLYAGPTTTSFIDFNLSDAGANNPSNKVRILSNGNVGIGTTAPSFKTTISADITKSGDINPGTAQLSLEGATTPGKRMILGYDTNSNGFGFIKAGNYGVTWTPLSLQPDGGNVGVGTTGPGYKLDVSGTIRATGDVIAYSDARVKENVETLDGALNKVMKMRGVSYNKIGEQEKKVGVIAQEILEVLPEVVSQDETGTYSVAYGNISAVLIEAIKELTNTVKEQQKQIDELKSKLK
jgi:hypothetical protein